MSLSSGDASGSAADQNAAPLGQMAELLRAKDDTSRFVGLALLKSFLENQPRLCEDIVLLNRIWENISPKFLDRLLKAGQNSKVSKHEANNMVDIAVAVLHTFTILLPLEACSNSRLLGRTATLVKALVYSSPESTVMILQTLLTFASHLQGAKELLSQEDLSPLTEIAHQQPMVLDILGMAWSIALTDNTEKFEVKTSIDKVIPMLLISFRGTDGVTFLAFLGETLPKLSLVSSKYEPPWLASLVPILRKLITNRPSQAGRSAYTNLAASLSQIFPLAWPRLIFTDVPTINNETKPFSYLFINLLLIDIRSSFPSLLSQINSPEYPKISSRLTSAFDVVTSFISFLVISLDDDDNLSRSFSLNMPPDLLLRLRKNVAETMSLTIEYLRDRWDASVAGAAGLHPSARSGAASTSEGKRLTLAWDSMETEVSADDLVLASMRALALWLREDGNENLRTESVGLMDMILELYQTVNLADGRDYQSPLLTILEVILPTDAGAVTFLAQNGWEILYNHLVKIIRNKSEDDEQSLQGLDIIRVLLAVLDHESTTEPREDWMEVVKIAASTKPAISSLGSLTTEFHIGVLQLATALLEHSSTGMLKRYSASITAIAGFAARLREIVSNVNGAEGREYRESLDDIILSLGNLR